MPTAFPPELPQRFLESFHRNVQTVIINLECKASIPPNCTETCFYGRPLCRFEPINEDLVKWTILSCAAKTCDLDAFPSHMLLQCLDRLLPYITSVIDDSLAPVIFPSSCSFKTAVVKALLRNLLSTPNDLKIYHPVSNMPFLSKITERNVLSQLNYHFI